MSVTGTYILYYFIVLSSFLFAWTSELLRRKSNQRLAVMFFIFAILLPITISGIRYGIGTDYDNYIKMYYNLSHNYSGVFDAYLNSRYEISWIVLNFLVEIFFDNPQYVFVFSSILIWLFSFKAIYDNKDRINISIAVLILLCILYNMSFNVIRQALAASIIMLSIKPLIERKLLKYFLIVIAASTFHFTAIIMLPLYFVVNSKIKSLGLLKRYIVPILFMLLIIFIEPIFSFITNIDIFSSYERYELDYRGFAKRDMVLKLPILAIIFLNYRVIKSKDNLMYKIGIIFIFGVILSFLRSYAPYIDRIAIFFDVSQVFIIAAIVKVQTNKYKKVLYFQTVFLYYIFWLSYNFLYLGRHETIPYEWILGI